MLPRLILTVAWLTYCLSACAAASLLVRNASIATVRLPQGNLPVTLTPAAFSHEIKVLLLNGTLQPGDLPRISRSLQSAFNPAFLRVHSLRIELGGASLSITSPAQLNSALSQISATQGSGDPLLGLANTVNSQTPRWTRTVIVGRLPAPATEANLLSAALTQCYLNQRLSVSFWALDGVAPDWAQNLSAATAGMTTASDIGALLPLWDEADTGFREAAWQAEAGAGGWPVLAGLYNLSGERLGALQLMFQAPGFAPSLPAYLAARRQMTAQQGDTESAAKAVLAINPGDVDALRLLAKRNSREGKHAESAALWRQVTVMLPMDAEAWSELSLQSLASGAPDAAALALQQAAHLGLTTRPLLEAQARLLVQRQQFSAALRIVEQLLASGTKDQSLWLLRAVCAAGTRQWPLQSESLERAAALGPLSFEQTTTLVDGYLTAGQVDRALPYLRQAASTLPADAHVHAQYAAFWEKLNDSEAAERLWRSAIALNSTSDLAYLGLAAHYLHQDRPTDALSVVNAGLAALPSSAPLILAKENALEKLGDTYAARRFLRDTAPASNQVDLVRRWAELEDCCGSEGARAYRTLLASLTRIGAPPDQINAVSRRGLLLALRTEHSDDAKLFAEKLAASGDRSGLLLLQPETLAPGNRVELLGGTEAFHFLLSGNNHSKPDRILLDYCRYLNTISPTENPTLPKGDWQKTTARIRDYFEILSALSALGTRKPNGVEITLSLQNKANKHRTERVFSILGLKLKTSKTGLTVSSSEAKSEVKKQDTLAALALDEQGIQDALAAGRSYQLELPIESVPIFPSPDLWFQSFPGHQQLAGGFFDFLLTDDRLPLLYAGLNSMDRAAAQLLVSSVSLRALAERSAALLANYSAALALRGNQAELPGGPKAAAVWRQLTGADPANAPLFFAALLSKDDGRLIAFFHTLSQLDIAHQRFFTRSPERAQRYYTLFRESPDMRRAGIPLGSSNAFTTFLREIPLSDDGAVDFPGDPEVWMVVKGASNSSGAVARLNRKLKRGAAPADEDQILTRLARAAYKSQDTHHSELSNFIAVARIDAQRETPMDRATALLLAQAYAEYEGLYGYFAQLGDLEAADYQRAFSLQSKLTGLDTVSANTYLGEVHSVLEMLDLLRESGAVKPASLQALYRKEVDAFLKAADPVMRVNASLTALDDLAALTGFKAATRDQNIRCLLIGEPPNAVTPRVAAYQRVLELQNVPSLEAFFKIRDALDKRNSSPSALDEVDRQLAQFPVLTAPNNWKLTGDRHKHLRILDTAEARAITLKLREKLARRVRNQRDVDLLSARLIAELEPWLQLAMTGQIYARFLDPSDMLVSEDPLLLRKHEFIDLGPKGGRTHWFPTADLHMSSEGEGSYLIGGFSEFAVAAGRARADGNHLGGPSNSGLAGAIFASVRATDWRAITPPALRSFGATVRLAREWIVESALNPEMNRELEADTLGVLSLVRRKTLLEGVANRSWSGVWQSVSISDLHFLGDTLLETAPPNLWNSAALAAIRKVALHATELDALGAVAPELSGCAQPRLRRYEPYEEYQRHFSPTRLAQRLSELKLYLAALADDSAWPLDRFPSLVARAADDFASRQSMQNAFDWAGALESYRSLTAADLEPFLAPR